jgi:hypothetical protein
MAGSYLCSPSSGIRSRRLHSARSLLPKLLTVPLVLPLSPRCMTLGISAGAPASQVASLQESSSG